MEPEQPNVVHGRALRLQNDLLQDASVVWGSAAPSLDRLGHLTNVAYGCDQLIDLVLKLHDDYVLGRRPETTDGTERVEARALLGSVLTALDLVRRMAMAEMNAIIDGLGPAETPDQAMRKHAAVLISGLESALARLRAADFVVLDRDWQLFEERLDEDRDAI